MGKLAPVVDMAEWKKLPSRPVQEAPIVEDPGITPSDILREVLGKAESLETVLILFRGKDGNCELTCNMEYPGEIFLFMEQIKLEMLARMNTTKPPGPDKRA